MRGVYPPISSHYSQDIKDVITKLLAVNPAHRPSIDDVLQMPQVRTHSTEFVGTESVETEFVEIDFVDSFGPQK